MIDILLMILLAILKRALWFVIGVIVTCAFMVAAWQVDPDGLSDLLEDAFEFGASFTQRFRK